MLLVRGMTLEEAVRAEIAEARAKQKDAEEVMKQAELQAKKWAELADYWEKGQNDSGLPG